MRRLALVALLAGCDPTFTLQGDVLDASGRPVPASQVVFECAGIEQQHLTPDFAGHFREEWPGSFGEKCSIEVRRPGAQPVSFGVMENCTQPYRHRFCTEVTLHAVMR